MRHKEMADKLEPAIEKITDQIGKLTLVAGRDGQVIGRRIARASASGSSRASREEAKAVFCESATRTSSRPT